jgi:hypothetical protein
VPPLGESVLSGVDDDEIGAVFDQVLSFGTNKNGEGAPISAEAATVAMTADVQAAAAALAGGNGAAAAAGDEIRTHVLDADVVKKLAAETAFGDVAEHRGNGAPATPSSDWFVAIDDQQVGPLSFDEVKRRWETSEIGPESLCWRAGFPDWLPIREVPELVSVLAPAPRKPIKPEVPVAPLVSVPVETSYNVGGFSRTVRAEVPVMAAAQAAAPAEEVSWKPSAASALASLVKEEIEALTKPAVAAKAESAKQPEKKVRGIFDLPSEEVAPAPRVDAPQTLQPAAASATPMLEPAAPRGPHAPVAVPSAEVPVAPAAYPVAPAAPYQAAPVSPYHPSVHALRPAPSSRWGLVAAIAVVVLGAGAVAGYLLVVQKAPPAQVAAITPAPPAPPAPAAAAPAAVPSAPAPAPANAAPQPAAQSPNGAEAVAAAPAAGQQPAAAAPAPAPATQATAAPTTPGSGETRPIAAAPKIPAPKIDPAPRGGTRVASASRRGEDRAASGGSTVTPAREERRPSGGASNEDEFDAVFGTSSDKKRDEPKKDTRPQKRDVYIPPAPGSADIPERLGSSDIMSVVLANKPSIMKCVSEQKAKDPGLSGKLVMRWTIKTNGRTGGVSVVSSELKSTYLASCISGLVRSWKFPTHRVQGDPVDFPFTF